RSWPDEAHGWLVGVVADHHSQHRPGAVDDETAAHTPPYRSPDRQHVFVSGIIRDTGKIAVYGGRNERALRVDAEAEREHRLALTRRDQCRRGRDFGCPHPAFEQGDVALGVDRPYAGRRYRAAVAPDRDVTTAQNDMRAGEHEAVMRDEET